MIWSIYPEVRPFTEEQIYTMLSDAVANGEVLALDAKNASLEFACHLLEDTGRITFADSKADEAELWAQRDQALLEVSMELS